MSIIDARAEFLADLRRRRSVLEVLTGIAPRTAAKNGWGAAFRAALPAGIRETIDQVESVKQALTRSEQIALNRVAARLGDLDLSSIWPVLLEALKDAALFYGGAVVVGATAGGVVGALGFGAGAVPGALVGAKVGSLAGTWLLGLLGLKSLVEYLGETIPQALAAYEDGFRLAWNAGEAKSAAPSGMPSAIHIERAASRLADGHAVILVALLAAIVAYLTRGKGDRANLLAEIRQSPRLGPKVADWVERNEATLVKHPALQNKSAAYSAADVRIGIAGPEGSPAPARNRPSPRHAEPSRKEPPPPPLKTMAVARPGCFPTNKLPVSKVPEFDRQLAGQQRGLNEMTVQEYLDGRDAYKRVGRDPRLARDARARHSRELVSAAEERLLLNGLMPAEALLRAREEAVLTMKTLAALHEPDMIAGGLDSISGFGDRNVNSRIGALWKKRVVELDEFAKAVPAGDRASIKMNTKLIRC